MKLVRANMSTGLVTKEDVPERFAGLGGRALTSMIISERAPADCDPLGADNLLVFAPGLLGGTPFANSGRLSIGAKSPLTGGIKESNVGGTMAAALARQGVKVLIVEGEAPEGSLHHLLIDDAGEVSLVDAGRHGGMRNYALAAALLAEYGAENAIACAGPAGEMRLAGASIQVTDPDGAPSRAAGRGGLGAVMGAKGLKAVIVSTKGGKAKPMHDAESFRKANTRFAKDVLSDGWSGRVLPRYGTASILAGANASGALPTRNARQGEFEAADRIDGDAMVEIIERRGGKTRHKGCSQCVIHCSNVYVDEAGRPVTSALEYETMWAMGAMVCIGDLDAIARLDFLCDDLGLDTMNTGAALAVAMDAGAMAFGDAEAAIEAVESVSKGTELGRLIGNGPDAVGRRFGHSRVPTVKGQSIAGYDPRAMPGMGVTYATSPMGADHTAGFLGGPGGDLASLREMSRSAQIRTAAMDSTGICMFAESGGLDNMFAAITALTGKPFGHRELRAMGERCLAAELDFNRRAGLSEIDDRLPKMFHEERLSPMHGAVPYSEDDLRGTLRSLNQSEGARLP